MSTIWKPILWSFSPPTRNFGGRQLHLDLRLMKCRSMIFDVRSYYFYSRSTWDSKWKSVGEESIQTISDKCDVRYSTLIFSIRSTWAGPNPNPNSTNLSLSQIVHRESISHFLPFLAKKRRSRIFKIQNFCLFAKNLERLAGQLFQFFHKKSKSQPWKNLESLNLETGTNFFTKKR